ncbi:MAG: MerR family transcriptional regulator [Burkholderiaceae bacterium]
MGSIVLPGIPSKRYFTIGEVSQLCQVKPHVLRYWEQEFTQLKPVKRRGNRRYYQHHEVLLIRRIRELLYEEGFTINGARHRLLEARPVTQQEVRSEQGGLASAVSETAHDGLARGLGEANIRGQRAADRQPADGAGLSASLRKELIEILRILKP